MAAMEVASLPGHVQTMYIYIYIDIIRSTSISTLASPFTMHTAGTSMV